MDYRIIYIFTEAVLGCKGEGVPKRGFKKGVSENICSEGGAPGWGICPSGGGTGEI